MRQTRLEDEAVLGLQMQVEDGVLDDLLKLGVTFARHVERREQVADETHEDRQVVGHDLGDVEITQRSHQHLTAGTHEQPVNSNNTTRDKPPRRFASENKQSRKSRPLANVVENMVLRGAGDGCGDMLATSGGPSDQWVPLSAWSLLPVFYRNYSPKCVVFTARRCANAVFAVLVHVFVRPFVHVSVCLSVTSWYCIETTGRIELVFGVEAFFHLSHTAL